MRVRRSSDRNRALLVLGLGGVLAVTPLFGCQRAAPTVAPRADAAPATAAATQPTPPKLPTEMKSSSYRITDISVSAGDLGGAAAPPPGTVLPTGGAKAPGAPAPGTKAPGTKAPGTTAPGARTPGPAGPGTKAPPAGPRPGGAPAPAGATAPPAGRPR